MKNSILIMLQFLSFFLIKKVIIKIISIINLIIIIFRNRQLTNKKTCFENVCYGIMYLFFNCFFSINLEIINIVYLCLFSMLIFFFKIKINFNYYTSGYLLIVTWEVIRECLVRL